MYSRISRKNNLYRILAFMLAVMMILPNISSGNVYAEDVVQELNVSNLTTGTFTETFSHNGFQIMATAEKNIVVDANSKTVDGVTYTQRLKLGGSGNADSRSICFTTSGAATVSVVAISANSTMTRTLAVAQLDGSNLTEIGTADYDGTSAKTAVFTVSQAGTYYVYSKSSGINLYDIKVVETAAAEPTSTPAPTLAPTAEPTMAPTQAPTAMPTMEPTVAPTAAPTLAPGEKVATPTLSIKGTFGGYNVTFFCENEGATIYYSTSSSALTTEDLSVENGGTVLISNYGSIYVRAYKDGQWSGVTRSIFKVPTVAAPTIVKGKDNVVTISSTTAGSIIYYTTDGTEPSPANGTKSYNSKATFTMNGYGTVKAIAVKMYYANSEVTSKTYAAPKPATPTYQVQGVVGGRQVTFSSATEGAEIYYSTTTSNITTDDIKVENGEPVIFHSFYGSIYVKAYKDGQWSNVARLILKIPTVNTPTIVCENGYATIKTTTPNATIYYTTDGTEPSPENGKIAYASGSMKVGTGVTVKAIAVRSCFADSAVASAESKAVSVYFKNMNDVTEYANGDALSAAYRLGKFTILPEAKFTAASTKTLDGIDFIKAYKVSSSDSPTTKKSIFFETLSEGTLTVYLQKGSSNASSATIQMFNKKGELIYSEQLAETGFHKHVIEIPEAGGYYITSASGSSINVYGLALQAELSEEVAYTEYEKQIIAKADNVLTWQMPNGGWDKAYDEHCASPRGSLAYNYYSGWRDPKGNPIATIDNGATYTHMRLVAQAYKITGEQKFMDSMLSTMDFFECLQTSSGGFTQVYPKRGNYSDDITLNDHAMSEVLKLLKEIYTNSGDFEDIFDEDVRAEAKTMFDKGIDFLLLAQVEIDGVKTGWAAQYDPDTLEPSWAREFEPPSIASVESSRVIELLINLEDNQAAVDAGMQALRWFDSKKIVDVAYNNKGVIDEATGETVYFYESKGSVIWYRFYDLQGRGFFGDRKTNPNYTANGGYFYDITEISEERRLGYGWITNTLQKYIDKYLNE